MSDTLKIVLYILVMAGITYLIRALPFVAFRKKIKSRFLKSLLYYLPYTVLSAMVIPSVFSSTGNVITAAAGFAIAVVLAFFNQSLIKVALGASAASFFAGVIINWI
jgi:branched-subunit amino acid transport protein